MDASEHRRDVLREYGYTDQQIDAMSPSECAAEYEDAIRSEVKSTSLANVSTTGADSESWGSWLQKAGAALAVMIFFAFVIACSVSIDERTPDEADVVVDLATNTYASIPCVIEGNTTHPLLTQTATLRTDPLPLVDGTLVGGLAVAREAGFKADRKCDAVDGFTISRKLISRVLGIGNRWTEDGRWRW
jgi:hypothetical protein